jgi:hypothetical protein
VDPVTDSSLLPEPVPWPPRRTRRLGTAILLASLLIAAGLYWWEIRSADDSEQFLAGYERQRNHDMGLLYGRGGRDLMDALEEAQSPGGHAVLVIAAGAIGAWICFYRARLVEEDERAKGSG